jgi:cytochrome c
MEIIMKITLGTAFTLAFIAVGTLSAHADGDVVAGEKVFKKCAACHVVDSDKKKVGPSLKDVIGRTAGTHPDFKYSKVMVEAGEGGLVWDDESLTGYLTNPKTYMKGNKMSFAGLKKEEDLANVIAYLKQFTPVQ